MSAVVGQSLKVEIKLKYIGCERRRGVLGVKSSYVGGNTLAAAGTAEFWDFNGPILWFSS